MNFIRHQSVPRILLSTILVLASLQGLWAQSDGQIQWVVKDITKGLIWKSSRAELFNSQQNINLLEVDLGKREVTLVYNPYQNEPTSVMAATSNALAAVNAGFFDVKNGGSVTYLKMDGEVRGDTTKWRSTKNLNGALIIKRNGRMEVEQAGKNARYTRNARFDDVLVTGSLLIDNKKKVPLPDNAFVMNRHPRTCIGIVNKRKILLVTIDGRAGEAAGMTLPELQSFMEVLGCKEAINLDGGGSTTMWIASEKMQVVNMPSDNRKFDHQGERSVSSILAVK